MAKKKNETEQKKKRSTYEISSKIKFELYVLLKIYKVNNRRYFLNMPLNILGPSTRRNRAGARERQIFKSRREKKMPKH